MLCSRERLWLLRRAWLGRLTGRAECLGLAMRLEGKTGVVVPWSMERRKEREVFNCPKCDSRYYKVIGGRIKAGPEVKSKGLTRASKIRFPKKLRYFHVCTE